MIQSSSVRTVLAIALGAVPGALGRYAVTETAKAIWGPATGYYGTFLVNFLGCFILAWVVTAEEARFRNWPPEVRLALGTGFCGAFTTFSTYSLETSSLLNQGWGLALGYGVGSAIVGMVGILLGRAMVRSKGA
ncbi:MAG TPA: fluoride efflux transporter CrcB [Thermosynechococcaceae cyanobacterium]